MITPYLIVVPIFVSVAGEADAKLDALRPGLEAQLEGKGVVEDDAAGQGTRRRPQRRRTVLNKGAVRVFVRLPLVEGDAHKHVLVEREVLHFDRAHHEFVVLLDDDVLERHVHLVELLSEVEVVRGRLREGHLPRRGRHLGDSPLGHLGDELDRP